MNLRKYAILSFKSLASLSCLTNTIPGLFPCFHPFRALLQSGIHSMFKLNLILWTFYFVDESILFPDATGSKRFILNVDVTPEHRPRRPRPHPRPRLVTHEPVNFKEAAVNFKGAAGNLKGADEDRIHSVIVNDEAVTSSLGASGSLRGSRRSIFSALGQWLCQGQGGPEALYVSPG